MILDLGNKRMILFTSFLLSSLFTSFLLSGEAGTGQPSPCNQWVADEDHNDNDNQGSLQKKKWKKMEIWTNRYP